MDEFAAMDHAKRNNMQQLSDDSDNPSGFRPSFNLLRLEGLKLLEESFGELEMEGLEDSFSAMQMPYSNFVQSQLQAKLSREQSSLNKKDADDAWDDGHQERKKDKSFVTDRTAQASESEPFEVRLKRKMSESATATEFPPTPRMSVLATLEEENNSEHSVTMLGASPVGEMRSESASSECESKKTFSSARDRLDCKIRARKAAEERRKREMGQSATVVHAGPPEPSPRPAEISPHFSAKESFDERLKKKMMEFATDEMRATREVDVGRSTTRPKVSAKKSFEERLKKKMMEFASDEMRATREANEGQSITRPKVSAIESFEERLKKKMSDSASVESTSPVKPSPLPPITSRKLTASESFEQRVKKKMSGSPTAMHMDHSNPRPVSLPSDTIPDKSNVKGSFIQSRKLTARESFEERLKKKMRESADIGRSSNNSDRLESKIRARKAVEDHLKRRMGGHVEVLSEKYSSPIESRNIAAKQSTQWKKMSESADTGRASDTSDRLESNIRARKAVEDRLKRRMGGHVHN